jgi:hypothetical protein
MVAYSENRSHGQTEPASCQTTKIDNCSLKASTGKSIHDGETSILSKGVGKCARIGGVYMYMYMYTYMHVLYEVSGWWFGGLVVCCFILMS